MTFHRHLVRPDAQAQASPWTSIAGKIQLEGETVSWAWFSWKPGKNEPSVS